MATWLSQWRSWPRSPNMAYWRDVLRPAFRKEAVWYSEHHGQVEAWMELNDNGDIVLIASRPGLDKVASERARAVAIRRVLADRRMRVRGPFAKCARRLQAIRLRRLGNQGPRFAGHRR